MTGSLGRADSPPADSPPADSPPASPQVFPVDVAEDPGVLLARFFGALAARDAARLAGCYHPLATYSSPLFPDLRGALPALMWRLALDRAPDLRIDWDVAFADPRKAQVKWTARWRQGTTERRLAVASTLSIWDGRIVRHVDEFRFPSFAAQALGVRGRLLGWNAAWRRRLQRRVRAGLEQAARAGAGPAGEPGGWDNRAP